MSRRIAALCVGVLGFASACVFHDETTVVRTDALDLTVTADAEVEQVDLYVRDDLSYNIVFHSGFNAVQAPGEKARDIRKDALKIALKLPRSGGYTVLAVGVIGEVSGDKPAQGATQLFWAGRVSVDGATAVPAKLLTVPDGDDADRDLWPDATNFVAHVPEAAKLYNGHPDLLDCDDKTFDPAPPDAPFRFKASEVNPFATDVCGSGYDENCNGNKDERCDDRDGDASITDCDDKDPKRHRPTASDPYPDPKNCCGYSLGKQGTVDANKDFTGDPMLCPIPRCGDGIDESCRGISNDPANDTRCVVDADCDGFPAPPMGLDCDDDDATVHPNAMEPCGSTKDLNCDGRIGGADGCVACDLDGDGFERDDPSVGCPDLADVHPGKVDCNDYDAAVFPSSTRATGGIEGGLDEATRLTAALRQSCRRVYEPTGATGAGTPRLSLPGAPAGDADCDGQPYKGCPPVACDADGDGFMIAGDACETDKRFVDCDDNDPTTYPGAPMSCLRVGSSAGQPVLDEDCSNTPKKACTTDYDHDGWDAGVDCDDYAADRHPWAVELCDGRDNDCDGLVDEGNPDANGTPMITDAAIMTCTDSDVGECGKTKGVCVCSIATPNSVTSSASRMICPTEDSGASKPPRCFGAGQPHPQTCDAADPKDDDCDGRTDAPDGADLAVRGMSCGDDVGGSYSGVITGCDSAAANCFTDCGLTPPEGASWVCSQDAVCPTQAECASASR